MNLTSIYAELHDIRPRMPGASTNLSQEEMIMVQLGRPFDPGARRVDVLPPGPYTLEIVDTSYGRNKKEEHRRYSESRLARQRW